MSTGTMSDTQAAAAAGVEYSDVQAVHGSLLVLRDVHGVGWDEFAVLSIDDGTRRHGLVLEVDRDLAVVQVLEGVDGLRPGGLRVRFTGRSLHIPLGRGWWGRVCNGRGEPIDHIFASHRLVHHTRLP